MQTSPNTSNTIRWYDRPWAAFIFFTRLPFWRLHEPPRECYRSVVEYWPLVGWLTGGLTGLVLWFGDNVLPYHLVIMVAIAFRMLLTGALHEDGLADFFDGFGGGGTNRQRILSIMKDSHTGTYGVLSLVIYVALLYAVLYSLGKQYAALSMAVIDPYAKMLAGQIIMMMPYARTEEEAKNKTVYRRMETRAGILLAIQGLLPIGVFCWYMRGIIDWSMLIVIPCLTMYFLYRLIWSRLHGYTGDCCGALCLLTELTALLTMSYYLGS